MTTQNRFTTAAASLAAKSLPASRRTLLLALSALLVGAGCAAPLEGDSELGDKHFVDNDARGYVFERQLRVADRYAGRPSSENGVVEFTGKLGADYQDGIVFDAKSGDAYWFTGTSAWSEAVGEVFENVIFEWVGPTSCTGAVPRTGGECEANDPRNWSLMRFDKSPVDDIDGTPRTRFLVPRGGRYMMALHADDYPHTLQFDWTIRMGEDNSQPRGWIVVHAEGKVLCPDGKTPVSGAVVGLEGTLATSSEDGTFDFGVQHLGSVATIWIEDPANPASIHHEDVWVKSSWKNVNIFMDAESCGTDLTSSPL